MEFEIYPALPGALLPWYRENRRELPWRADREAYHIWLSEIMLQQTRVEAVKGYYTRFLDRLPAISALAACDDDLLHKLWEGLGYYSRVRNLKKAAQVIMADHGGTFPANYDAIRALPGIGDYTAGAISSIAFNDPRAAVDGNVLRVISRLTDDATPIDSPAYKNLVRTRLEEIYPPEAGEFTQALMELGATLCGPNWKPRCEECPCRDFCRAHLHGTAENLPVKTPKKKRKTEEKTVFILSCDGAYAICKRPDTGLLAGLWQFPDAPGLMDTAQAIAWLEERGIHPRELLRQTQRKHIFTHIEWKMRGFYLEVKEPGGGFVWRPAQEIEAEAALPTAYRQFWEEIDHV